jgi:hypothetical protein
MPTNVYRIASLQNKNEQDQVDNIVTFDDNHLDIDHYNDSGNREQADKRD